jgi:hypothetical protein
MLESGFMQNYRSALFSRIVPIIKDIGLWGPKIRKGYEQMNILGYANVDVQAMADEDEKVAERYDERHAEIVRVAASAVETPTNGTTVKNGNGGSRASA